MGTFVTELVGRCRLRVLAGYGGVKSCYVRMNFRGSRTKLKRGKNRVIAVISEGFSGDGFLVSMNLTYSKL